MSKMAFRRDARFTLGTRMTRRPSRHGEISGFFGFEGLGENWDF